MPKDYYVYAHYKLTTGEIFYVGKGTGYRLTSKKRNIYWARIAQKHGVIVKVLIDGLQEWAAYEIENGLVNLHGRVNDGTGVLCNLADGGEGSAGQVITQAQKEFMSRVNKGRKTSEETKKLLSEISKKNKEKISKATRDNNIYTFVHVSGVTFTGLRVEFKDKFSIEPRDLFLKTHKRKEQDRNWTLLKDNEKVQDAVNRIIAIQSNYKKLDESSYNFIHKTGELFSGTRRELSATFNIPLSIVHTLFSRSPRKSVYGWSLYKEQHGAE